VAHPNNGGGDVTPDPVPDPSFTFGQDPRTGPGLGVGTPVGPFVPEPGTFVVLAAPAALRLLSRARRRPLPQS
jgi:hypothetical protein